MYFGVSVEEAEAAELVDRPAHPYTAPLLAACGARSGGEEPILLATR